MLKKIVSFGFRHNGHPEKEPGAVVVDVRAMFRNPYRNYKLRHKRGTDPDVQEDVMKTPNFLIKYAYVKEQITVPGTEIAYIGCSGGHHRSVFLAERLGQELGVPVEHRDISKE